jgi:hypothetical protein
MSGVGSRGRAENQVANRFPLTAYSLPLVIYDLTSCTEGPYLGLDSDRVSIALWLRPMLRKWLREEKGKFGSWQGTCCDWGTCRVCGDLNSPHWWSPFGSTKSSQYGSLPEPHKTHGISTTHCVLMPPVRPRGYVVVAKMQGQAGSEAPDNKSNERTNALLSGEDPAQIHPRIIQPIDQMRWPLHIVQQYFGYSWSSKISSHLSGRLPCDNPESAPDLLGCYRDIVSLINWPDEITPENGRRCRQSPRGRCRGRSRPRELISSIAIPMNIKPPFTAAGY